MRRVIVLGIMVCTAALVGPLIASRAATAADRDPNLLAFENAGGQLRTFNVGGALDLYNPFFQDLGTKGRRCVTCHQPDNAWTITPANVQARFAASQGTDPIFHNNDGWLNGPTLTASDATANAEFGFSVSLSADASTALVGGPFNATNGVADAGAAWIFDSAAGTWTQGQTLIPNDEDNTPAGGGFFGWSVALAAGSVLTGDAPIEGARIVAVILTMAGVLAAVRFGWVLAGPVAAMAFRLSYDSRSQETIEMRLTRQAPGA